VSDSTQAERFQQLAMPHMDAAYNLARWLTGNSHDAEDVTQEAFLRAFRFFGSFRGDDPRTWLLTIVRNTYYTQYRKARSRDESTEFDEDLHSLDDGGSLPAMGRADGDPLSIVGRADDLRLLDQALQELPEDYREALVLREVEDLSYKEIAATMAVPMGTVMSRLARGREMLMKTFQRLGGEHHEPRQAAVTRIR